LSAYPWCSPLGRTYGGPGGPPVTMSERIIHDRRRAPQIRTWGEGAQSQGSRRPPSRSLAVAYLLCEPGKSSGHGLASPRMSNGLTWATCHRIPWPVWPMPRALRWQWSSGRTAYFSGHIPPGVSRLRRAWEWVPRQSHQRLFGQFRGESGELGGAVLFSARMRVAANCRIVSRLLRNTTRNRCVFTSWWG